MSDDEELKIDDLEFGNLDDDESEKKEETKATKDENVHAGGLDIDNIDDEQADAGDLELGGADEAAPVAQEDSGIEMEQVDGGDLELGGADEAVPMAQEESGLEMEQVDGGDLELGGADEAAPAEQIDSGLDLAVADTEGLEIGGAGETAPAAENDSGLELADADTGGLEIGGADETAPAAEIDTALELADADTGGLEIGGAEETAPAAEIASEAESDLSLGAEDVDTEADTDIKELELGSEGELAPSETESESDLSLGPIDGDADGGALDLGAPAEELPEMSAGELPVEEDKDKDYQTKIAEIDVMMSEAEPEAAKGDKSDATSDIDIPDDMSLGSPDDDMSLGSPEPSSETPASEETTLSNEQLDDIIEGQEKQPATEQVVAEMPIPAASQGLKDGEDQSTHVRNQLAEINQLMEEGDEPVEGVKAELPESVSMEQAPTKAVESSEQIEEQKIIMEHHSDELLRLQGIINELRDDRAKLLEKIDDFEDKVNKIKQNNLSERAELEETRIELSLVKKNLNRKVEDYQTRFEISNEKKDILLENKKQLQNQLEELKSELHRGIQKIGTKEKDLENKIEMLRSDSEVQISNRDEKILELKRKIDTLEFNLKNVSSNEQKSKMLKIESEEKINKVMNTLRNAISILDDDGNIEHKLQVIKKSFDV